MSEWSGLTQQWSTPLTRHHQPSPRMRQHQPSPLSLQADTATRADAMRTREVPIEWQSPATEVRVVGSFDNWTTGVELSPDFIEDSGEQRDRLSSDGWLVVAAQRPRAGDQFARHRAHTVHEIPLFRTRSLHVAHCIPGPILVRSRVLHDTHASVRVLWHGLCGFDPPSRPLPNPCHALPSVLQS